MKNEYEIRGDVTAIFLNNRKFGKLEALISTNKLERAMEYPNSWYPAWREESKTFYVMSRIRRGKGKVDCYLLHRWVTGAEKGYEVDHFDHDGLNNTDENLRVVTSSENKQNHKGARVDSRSGVRGVTWHPHTRKWRAGLKVNGKRIEVGLFADLQDADKAMKEARAKYMPYSQEASGM